MRAKSNQKAEQGRSKADTQSPAEDTQVVKSVIDEFTSRVSQHENEERSPEEKIGWYDSTLNANYWINDDAIAPEDAAKLLAGLNPRTTPENWFTWTTAEASADALYALHQWAMHQHPTSLALWYDNAKKACKFASYWVADYLNLREGVEADGKNKHRPRRTTPAQDAEIVRRFKNRESVYFLAKEFGVSRRTIDNRLMEEGLKTPRKK